MRGRRRGKIVVLHLAARYPFAGVIWQLIHHLVGFRELGFDVYYIEDHGAHVYDPSIITVSPNPARNLALLDSVLTRYGFGGRWSFYDVVRNEYVGMNRALATGLIAEADMVVNLCGATEPREEHLRSQCMVYLETDPGVFQVHYANREPQVVSKAAAHKLFFTYGYNIGAADCVLPAGKLGWRPTRPPVLLSEWPDLSGGSAPLAFTTVGTWRNRGSDIDIGGRTYYWSKHTNFESMLEVASRAEQPIELATDLDSGPEHERALRGGFSFRPVVPMSLDIDTYRDYIGGSRGEFTVAKDLYVNTRSGWFSDRSACYLASGRPVVTQRTGFEKFIPTGEGLLGFDDAAEAVEAIRRINRDYRRHARAAREIAAEYFDSAKLLDDIARAAGL